MYFLLGPRTVQRALGDDLGGRDALCLQVSDLVALGETTTTQCLPAGVLLDHHLPVSLGDFLLDHRLLQSHLLLGLFSLLHQ